MTTFLLNNCHNLNHREMYSRPTAFYDLWAKTREDKKAKMLEVGDICIVLSRDRALNQYTFMLYEFESKHLATDRNLDAWVLCGKFRRGDILTYENALIHPYYRQFFNKLGALKQSAALVSETEWPI